MKYFNLFRRYLSAGYFPKELPPPFNTSLFGRKAASLLANWEGEGLNAPRTRADTYSIPRYERARRKLSIPNPISHFFLSKCICSNWDTLKQHMEESDISLFEATRSSSTSRVFDPLNFENIEAIKNSVLAKCGSALMTDISRFYPTIYTHSIAWALHGKNWCKEHVNTPVLRDSVGQKIDDLVRKGQDGQSIGIPLGPDTSIVVSEILGAAIDKALANQLWLSADIAFRYTDDFFIGLRDSRTVDGVVAAISSALSVYELEISSDKTREVFAAQRADPDWALEISQFRLPTATDRKRRAIEYYFKKAFHLAQTHASQNVLNYCVTRSQTFSLDKESWSTYEEFLMQIARSNATTIEIVSKILTDGERNGFEVNRPWVERLIVDLLLKNAPLDNHWEISWLLFLCRELRIKLPFEAVSACEAVRGSAVGLLLLDLGMRELADVGAFKHKLVRELNEASLESPEWLLVYESVLHDWLGEAVTKIVLGNDFFKVLHANSISFYDSKRTTRLISKEKAGVNSLWHEPSYFRF